MKELNLTEKVKPVPDVNYDEIDLPPRKTVDQTSSGQLTTDAIDLAMDKAEGIPEHVIIPPRHQYNIRRDVLFETWREERLGNGVIGKYLGAIVSVDEELENRKNTPAFVITESQKLEDAAVIQMS